MKKITTLLTGGLLSVLSHPALAHGGDHAVGFVGNVTHFLSDPFHFWPIVAAAVLVLVIISFRPRAR